MSHVTRHTSHVTRHTSHVTRHTSHAPPAHLQMSHFACNILELRAAGDTLVVAMSSTAHACLTVRAKQCKTPLALHSLTPSYFPQLTSAPPPSATADATGITLPFPRDFPPRA
jgi:hypothetical protein